MQATEGLYTPRAGSKVSLALKQLEHGPATDAQLALAMECEESSVSALMHKAKENGLVVRAFSAAGILHYALASIELPPGFSSKGAQRLSVDPKDPFGLAARCSGGAAGVGEGTGGQPPKAEEPAAAAAGQDTSARPIASARGPFLAALFSTGELMIQVGDDQVFLNPDHQRQLQQYCARFEV